MECMTCEICQQDLLKHSNYPKCFLLMTLYTKDGQLTPRGQERAKEWGIKPSNFRTAPSQFPPSENLQ